MINLNNITLISIDGTGSNTNKLKNIFNICSKDINFINITYLNTQNPQES
jgi:hypothetical protein